MAVRISRRKFLAGLGVGALACGTYSHFEATCLDVGRHSIKVSKLSDWGPLTILHISDLHASEWVSLDYLRKAIDIGLELKPDLICMTGDYVSGGTYDQFDAYAQILKRLPAAAPTFACLGNNDAHHGIPPNNSAEVRQLLRNSGIEFLDNTAREVQIKNSRLRLIGVGDIYTDVCKPSLAFSKVPVQDDSPVVVLSHNPDSKTFLRSYAWDLLLCGHTHGGQACVPFLGAPVVPIKDRRYVAGLYRWENRWLHVTKGIGNWYGLRFNCRPEVSLLTLT